MMANLIRGSKSVTFDLYCCHTLRPSYQICCCIAGRMNHDVLFWPSGRLPLFQRVCHKRKITAVRPSVVRSLLNRCCVAAGEGRRFIEKHASSPTVFKVAIVSRDRPPQKVCLAVQKRSVTRYVRDLLEMLNVQKSSFAAYPLVKTQKIYCFDTRYSCLSGGARGERGASGPCPISLGCYSASAPLSAPLI